MGRSIREDIQAAADELRGTVDDSQGESNEQVSYEGESGDDSSDHGSRDASDSSEHSDRARDERGRFSTRDAAKHIRERDGGSDAEGTTDGPSPEGERPELSAANAGAASAPQDGASQPNQGEPESDEVKIQATHTYQDLKEDWAKLPRSIQERLVLRDRQRDSATEKTLSEARKAREGWEPIESVFSPEDMEVLKAVNSTPAVATRRLWNAHKNMDANPDAGLLFLANQYPVNRVGVATALLGGEEGLMQVLRHFSQTGQIPYGQQMQGQYNGPASTAGYNHAPQDPQVAQLQERIEQLSSTVQQLNGTAQQQRLGSLSDQFQGMMQETNPDGSPARPYMAEIVDDVLVQTKQVIAEVKANRAPPGVGDIRSAVDEGYRRAVRLNPVTYARLLDAERQRGAARVTTTVQNKTQSARLAAKQVSGAPGSTGNEVPTTRLDQIKHFASQQRGR